MLGHQHILLEAHNITHNNSNPYLWELWQITPQAGIDGWTALEGHWWDQLVGNGELVHSSLHSTLPFFVTFHEVLQKEGMRRMGIMISYSWGYYEN